MRLRATLLTVLVAGLASSAAGRLIADEAAPGAPVGPSVEPPSAERGYRWLTTKAYVPASFDQAAFDALWTVWPAPAREEAEKAAPEERRRLLYARYGLTPRPEDPTQPLQYVVDAQGRWSMSCLACHAGQVSTLVLPGLPNAHLALQDLTDDLAALRRQQKRLPSLGEAMWSSMPLGETHGTTNAVMFSVALLAFRDKDLNVVPPARPPRFAHHDLDAPPWWHVARRATLYVDGFTPKGHRPLMQFLLVPTNGPSRLKAWESDFRDILAYLEGVKPPRWPFAAPDPALVARGRAVFERSCSACHGTYGERPTYPERTVPIREIGTDRARLDAILPEERQLYADSWFTAYQPQGVKVETGGYVAPPLDGVWASAPYLHNGSVPTLWHLLNPQERPKAWRRAPAPAYDEARGGLALLGQADAVPAGLDAWTGRAWFDTAKPGKSAGGHLFPQALSPEQREAVLAYLKTL